MATQNDPNRQGAEGGAQVYKEKGKGLPWWAFLLLALLLLALLYALLGHHGSSQQAATTTPAATAPAVAPADTTTPAPVAAADNAAATGTAAPAGQNIKVHSGADIATAKPGQASVPASRSATL